MSEQGGTVTTIIHRANHEPRGHSLCAMGFVKAGGKRVTAVEAEDCVAACLAGGFKPYAKPGSSPRMVNDLVSVATKEVAIVLCMTGPGCGVCTTVYRGFSRRTNKHKSNQ
jgi:hypothetical protein